MGDLKASESAVERDTSQRVREYMISFCVRQQESVWFVSVNLSRCQIDLQA